MNDLICPRCSTRFIQGETTCEFCGFKTVSKFSFKKQANEYFSGNDAIRRIELEELDRQSARKSIFRKSERKYLLQVIVFTFLFVAAIVIIAIISSS